MSTQIIFETINPEEQKSKVQLESKIMYNIDGKEIYPEEESGWFYQEFSGFAPKKFIEDPAKRDFVKFQLDPEQKSCMDLKIALLKNDEAFEENRKMIFGKFDRLYKFLPSVKPPKGKDEEELSEDEAEEDKPQAEISESKPAKFDSVKMKLKMDWFYYYDNKRLDRTNTNSIKKAVGELMKNTKTANLDKEKKKLAINALPIKLSFKDDQGKKETVEVLMKDIEQRKEIDTKVFYRKPEKIEQNAKKPFDCSEEELVQIYGDPMDPQDVRTPDDLDQFYRNRCYVRFLYKPMSLWASKDKMAGADKRTCGIKYIIYQIDIIQLPYEQNLTSTQRTIYSKYAFGKKNILINQSVDSVFTSIEKSTNEKESIPEITTTNKSAKDEKSKSTKKEMKVESEDEKSSDDKSESEESESGSESEESEESESEEEVQVKPVKKGGKNAKTVVETPIKTKASKIKK
jgi:hypothetical protein